MKMLNERLICSYTCGRGSLREAKRLVKHTKADASYHAGWIPLNKACGHIQFDIVKYLVETCHANINLPDNYIPS